MRSYADNRCERHRPPGLAEQQQRGKPDPDLAATLLADFANEFPGAWKAREMRAGILKETGRVDEALAELQGMEQAFPNEAGVDTTPATKASRPGPAGTPGTGTASSPACARR
mgnify:CR=1 FL=1